MEKFGLFLILFFTVFVSGADYYVKNGGNDSKNGLSDANALEYSPGMSSYSGGISLSAGDSVLFNKDDSWR